MSPLTFAPMSIPAIPRSLILPALAGWLLAAPPLHAQFDDFADGNDAGWTRYDPLGGLGAGPIAHFSFPNGGYRIRSAESPNPALAGPSRAGSLRLDTIYTGFCVTVDVIDWDPLLEQSFGLLARVQPNPGLGTTSGYVVTYQPDDQDLQISRIDDEAPTDISGFFPVSLELGRSYRFLFMGDGDYLEARVYELPNLLDPLISVVAFDDTYSSGHCGLVVYDHSESMLLTTDATFDNFQATDLTPPALEIVPTATDEFNLFWDAAPLCYDLESSKSLAADAVWTRVTSGIILRDGRFRLDGGVEPGSRFYRLRRFGD